MQVIARFELLLGIKMCEMKKIVLGFLLTVTCSAVFSQKLYFMYLQTEPQQAFFVKMNDKVHSSSASGYLILSRLRDTIYTISIGFPQSKWPEQKYSINIKGKDRGYLLKNTADKGWVLFDIETMTIQPAQTDNNAKAKTESKDVSAFTEILSKAANDPSLKERPVMAQPAVVKEDKKPATEQAVLKTEQPVVEKKDKTEQPLGEKKEEVKTIINDQPAAKKEEAVNNNPPEQYKRSVVTRKSESITPEGLHLVFVDDYGNGKRDTIRIIIPEPKKAVAVTKEPKKEEKKFLDITTEDTLKEKKPAVEANEPKIAPVSKSNCIAVAAESDFLRLRKKMAAATRDDEMVDEARKYFKIKCFTVLQVKNISVLFLNDSGKYKFFDAAYEHVSDPDNFSSLGAELKDEYYVNRFKAMLR